MDKKIYMIIGGTSGIGFSVAEMLAQKGADLYLTGRDSDKLQKTISLLPGQRHRYIICDIENLSNISRIFTTICEAHILLDGMVFCAGISPLCLVRDNSVELMEKVFRTNLFSFIELVKEFQKEQISRDGARIVAISSITAHGAGYRQTLYGSSKAALISAVKLMSRELMNRNIRINCVSPGVTETPMLRELRIQSANFDDKVRQNQMLGIIPPEQIAAVIVNLLGTGSDFITGSEIVLDGGAHLK